MAVSLNDDSSPSGGPICPVCFRDYSDNETNLIPRILQCGHTYCTECLDRLLNTEQDEDDFEQVVLQIRYGGREWTTVRRQPLLSRAFQSNDLKCPTCNAMNYISNRDIHSLTKNYALLGLQSSNDNQASRKSKRHFCTEHNHEKRVYCNDCRMLVCAYCQLYGGHKDHDCAIATDAAQPSVEALKVAVEGIKCDLNDLNSGEKVVEKAVKRLKKDRYQCERRVKGYFNDLIRSLENKRNSLLMNIGSWTDEQMYILNAQLESLTSALSDSDSLQKKCDNLVKGDPLDALSQHDETVTEVTDLRRRIEGLSLHPIINPWIKCNVTEASDDVLTDLLKNCTLTHDTDTPSVEEPMVSDGERGDSDSFTCDDILSSSDKDDDGDDCQQHQLHQEGAGASASPPKGKKKLYSQETQLLQHWSPLSGLSSDAGILPTLDSSDYSTSWSTPLRLRSSGTSSLVPTMSTLPPSTQGSYPSPPNNSFLSSSDMPTSQASDPNSMFLNPISTKAKYTNLLQHGRRSRTLTRLDSASNSDPDEEGPRLRIDRPYDNGHLSSSDSQHSDDDTEVDIAKSMFGTGSYGLHSSRFQHMFSRPFATGELSASPDEDDDDHGEGDDINEGERIETTGEIFALHGSNPLPPRCIARHQSCPSPSQEEDDFAFSHHLGLPGNASQSNEIVIPLRNHYSWTAHIGPSSVNRRSSQNSGGNRAHVQLDVNQVGPVSVDVSIDTRGGRGGDGTSETDSDHEETMP